MTAPSTGFARQPATIAGLGSAETAGRGQAVPTPGQVGKVVFSNIIATGGSLASSITGLPGHPLRDVTLSDVDITMAGGGSRGSGTVPEAEKDYPHAPMFGPLPASGLYFRHVEGLALHNVRIHTVAPDARAAIVLDDVADADLDAGTRRLANAGQQ